MAKAEPLTTPSNAGARATRAARARATREIGSPVEDSSGPVCFRCGQVGHTTSDCPGTRRRPPAQRAPAVSPATGPLSNYCPVCAVEPRHTCRNLVTGAAMYRDGVPVTHPARGEAAWNNPALLARRAELRNTEGEYIRATGQNDTR